MNSLPEEILIGQISASLRFFIADMKHFDKNSSYLLSMNTTGKIAIGVGIASGVLLAAWLLTGSRKEKTKKLISKGTARLKGTLKTPKSVFDDSEAHFYI